MFTLSPFILNYLLHLVMAFTIVLLTGELDLGTVTLGMALYANQLEVTQLYYRS